MKNFKSDIVPIVLCAGLGTRLRPLTHMISKVVAPIGDCPIALTTMRKLLDFGFPVVHCNTHYLADVVVAELRAGLKHFGYDENRVKFWHEEELLNSGGGIQRIWEAVCADGGNDRNKDVLVISGDLFAYAPIQELCDAWAKLTSQESAIMMTKQLVEERSDVTWVSSDLNRIVGFGNDELPEQNCISRNFTGHQIILSRCLRKAKVEKKSSVDMYFRAALQRGELIKHITYSEEHFWYNIGTYREYAEAMNSPSVQTIQTLPLEDCLRIADSRLGKADQAKPTSRLLPIQLNTLREYPMINQTSLLNLTLRILAIGLANHTHNLPPNSLCFRFEKPLLKLKQPVLIPLELYHAPWGESLPSLDPYLSSQTYLLIQ